MSHLPLLSLYIHIPWCAKKCPYCDFNTYVLNSKISHFKYVQHLLNDLEKDLILISNRKINTVFIGGGTPNLMHSDAIQMLMDGIRTRVLLATSAEITMEVNPGNIKNDHFCSYQHAGINRISIGIQSLNKKKLEYLGRLHGPEEAKQAVYIVNKLGLHSFNLDLIYGLPKQSLKEAIDDLYHIIDLNPPHISWYQLTIEPNTIFSSRTPILPDDDLSWNIFKQGHNILTTAGYYQYEISSYSKMNHRCEHNLNYWRFGDYIGIGCGAHGKLTQPDGRILRTVKTKNPYGYMQYKYLDKKYEVPNSDKPFEFFMNRFRLLESIPRIDFNRFTGLNEQIIRPQLDKAISIGYILETANTWLILEKGKLFLNSLLELFL